MPAPPKRSRSRPANSATKQARAQRDDFAVFICEQLAGLPTLKCRPMFGGHGLYSGERFFGILWCGALYFKTSPETVADYVAADMGRFRPGAKQTLHNYYEVPARVLERRGELLTWARRAAAI